MNNMVTYEEIKKRIQLLRRVSEGDEAVSYTHLTLPTKA